MLFSELNWPKKLNLKKLSLLTEKELQILILDNLDKDRLARRIVLPSAKCFRKCVAFYFGCLVAEGKMSWDQVMV